MPIATCRVVREALARYADCMNSERGIFDNEETPEQTTALDAQALASVAAGRFIPHEEVAKWLKTWGTPDFKPMPREWLE
jgi:predicted transcriptional regulator